MLIVESSAMDVYRNLAIEEFLVDNVRDQGPILFLWRSDCAVVMGKNQNPWRECHLDRINADGVVPARRISGGGTVYHDAGNLNYCVIVDREAYQEEKAYEIVFSALAQFGVKVERTGKSNLSVGGKKFSGNAFAFRRGRALHHGTLLLDTNLERLGRYLGSMIEGIQTHAIASVPADVANLGLDVAEVSAALKSSFCRLYADGRPVAERVAGEEAVFCEEESLRRHASDSWIYGATPTFSFERNDEVIKVVKGVVQSGAEEGRLFKDVAYSWFCLVD